MTITKTLGNDKELSALPRVCMQQWKSGQFQNLRGCSVVCSRASTSELRLSSAYLRLYFDVRETFGSIQSSCKV